MRLFLFIVVVFTFELTSCFKDFSLYFGSKKVKTPMDFFFNFTTTRKWEVGEALVLQLPLFTRRAAFPNATRLDLGFGQVKISPSLLFSAEWEEGSIDLNMFENKTMYHVAPFRHSRLRLVMKGTAQVVTTSWNRLVYTGISSGTVIKVKVYKENGIGAWCGFPSSSEVNNATFAQTYPKKLKFQFHSNFSDYNYNTTFFDIIQHNGVGPGCAGSNWCNGHGSCDYCLEKCLCYPGYGAASDVVTTGYQAPKDCSDRVCPMGKSFAPLVPAVNRSAHENTTRPLTECSDRGICDRTTGECHCFETFTGSACERMRCPNDCSGHGKCVSMRELALTNNPYSRQQLFYGSSNGYTTTAWDYDVIYGCVCDSSWTVGYGYQETQLAEYFGPDCSLRRCPSGDNPYTAAYEKDCNLKNQLLNITKMKNESYFGLRVGDRGNYCHIDCSNRGVCDYSTGKCSCFDGSWGPNCGQQNSGTKFANFDPYDEF